jgi:hypothetical protein
VEEGEARHLRRVVTEAREVVRLRLVLEGLVVRMLGGMAVEVAGRLNLRSRRELVQRPTEVEGEVGRLRARRREEAAAVAVQIWQASVEGLGCACPRMVAVLRTVWELAHRPGGPCPVAVAVAGQALVPFGFGCSLEDD